MFLRLGGTCSLTALRQKLLAVVEENKRKDDEDAYDGYSESLQPLLDLLEERYGDQVPLFEVKKLQKFIDMRVARVRQKRDEIIDQARKDGKTVAAKWLRDALQAKVEVESVEEALRQRTFPQTKEEAELTLSMVMYQSLSNTLDKHYKAIIDELEATYGPQIPIPAAYEILKYLEKGDGPQEQTAKEEQ
jgi:hypothetical protein